MFVTFSCFFFLMNSSTIFKGGSIMDIAIVGAGGMGREVLNLIQIINLSKQTYNFIGWYDDLKTVGETVNGYPVLGNISDINHIQNKLALAIAIGYPGPKSLILERISNNNIFFPNFIHPNVVLNDFQYLSLGQGIIIQSNTSLTTNIKIDDFVFISSNCTIGHDSSIGMYSSVMPGVNIAGNVTIHQRVLLGISSCVLQGLEILSNSIIGGGACVVRNTEEGLTYIGVPAKPLR